MIGEYKLRKARKEYRCTERSYHTIAKGQHYLFMSAPPWHECAQHGKWLVTRACLRCAREFGMHNHETQQQADAIGRTDPAKGGGDPPVGQPVPADAIPDAQSP